MKDLQSVLSRLGLSQYFDKFKEEGFEQWETVLDITESDLYGFTALIQWLLADQSLRDALGVKLGHRRVSSPKWGLPENRRHLRFLLVGH